MNNEEGICNKHARNAAYTVGSPKHINHSNSIRRRFATEVDIWQKDAIRSRWMQIQRHAEGMAKFTAVISAEAKGNIEYGGPKFYAKTLTDVTPE